MSTTEKHHNSLLLMRQHAYRTGNYVLKAAVFNIKNITLNIFILLKDFTNTAKKKNTSFPS